MAQIQVHSSESEVPDTAAGGEECGEQVVVTHCGGHLVCSDNIDQDQYDIKRKPSLITTKHMRE